jgi:hypothetical protein
MAGDCGTPGRSKAIDVCAYRERESTGGSIPQVRRAISNQPNRFEE